MAKVQVDTKPLPELERLDYLFNYDSLTGRLTWKNRPSVKATKVSIGKDVGYKTERGYIQTCIDGEFYSVHRICFKIHNRRDPIGQIDHSNRIKWDNSALNLVEVDQSMNNYNRKVMSNSKSGIRGIKEYHKGNYSCWLANYKIMGERFYKTFPFTNEGLAAAMLWLEENRP